MNPLAAKSNGLRLLAIEGRGVCGLTALITLKEVMRQYQYLQKLPQLPRPSDVFDLVGGTGTGGIIAIMLFRLGMTVDEAITAYTRLSEDVFSKKPVLSHKTNASLLENAIAKIIQPNLNVDNSQAQKIRMLDDRRPKCFVTVSTAKNLSSPTLFRTYTARRHASYNCTIVEAMRATTAEEPFFPSINIGDPNVKEEFIHGGLRLNNPVKAVLGEAVSMFPGQSISCVLSIGSGVQGITGFVRTSATKRAKVLKDVMNDGECISDEVAKELSDRDVFYCRLNVDHGLGDIGFDDWERLGDVRTHTQKYLEKYDATQKVTRLMQVLSRRTANTTTVEETLLVLSKFLDDTISILPGESWRQVTTDFIRMHVVELSNAATESLNVQCALLCDTLENCLRGKDFAELPEELNEIIRHLLEGLKKVFQDSPGQEDPIVHVNANIQKLLQRFWMQNHIAGNIMVHDILKHIQEDDTMKKTFTRHEQHAINQNLDKLNVAPFAAYDSSEVSEKVSCFKGTRVRLLSEIAGWIAGDDPSLAPIYVLDGVAGIGKSTIAKTIAEHAAGINALGASFFFSRNDDKRKTAKTFFPTIAYQLAYYDKAFAEEINEGLLRTPHVITKTPLKQFSTLIMDPLKEAFAVEGNPILVVIDALDECEDDGDVLLNIFADSIKNMPRLKLFITTRPEYHIRNVLDRYCHLRRFHLQDIEKSVVQSDIRLYLDFHLSRNQVRVKMPDLQCTWKPAEKDMERLIEACGTLFIMASTAVKFILDNKRSDPEKQLSRLLKSISHRESSGLKYATAMDSFYTQILLSAVPDDSLDDDDDDNWFTHYQVVVGTIVALQYPLSCIALSTLVGLVPDDVKRALSHLYSLVAPTSQDLIFRIHHKSFPDFVVNPSRCERRFLIDLSMRHLELGKCCLRVMNSQLKPNICNLDPTDRFKDGTNNRRVSDYIPQGLAYASVHWATHLAYVSELDSETEDLLEDFARKHFLAWLETLSIIGQVEIAYPSLDRIGRLFARLEITAGITREIFHDGCRFIALNIELIKVAAGHVFSALAFVPQDTRLFRTYEGMKGHVGVVSGYEREWNSTISVMTGHSSAVNCVTFSGDGAKLASASDDGTVRLWDGQTGAKIAVLQGHSMSVKSVVFSPDSMRLASASDDGTVRLWDGKTGAEIAVLRGHLKRIKSVVFSPDGLKLASASCDKTMRLWDGQTGTKLAILRGHSKWVESVVFSPDGVKLASASADQTVRLWDCQTGAKIVLRGHFKLVKSVVFSPDGMKLASTSDDGTVRLWDRHTGAEIAVLRGHSVLVKSVVFSPDGMTLASASDDQTVRLWDGQTGAEVAVLRGHSKWVESVVFSPDGMKLASSSGDRTVRLWACQTFAVLRQDSVNSMTFSPDGMKLASATDDGTMQLWDGRTGAEIVVLRGHSNRVNSMTFSVSPDGMRLASASDDQTVRLWDGQMGAEIAVLRGHTKRVNSVVFSPNGMKLASTSDDQTVRLWDGQTGADIAVLRGHSKRVDSLVFSPDGMKLASTSDDQTVRLWNGKTGAEITVLQHLKRVKSMVFSPDGMKLTSLSDDGTRRLWDGQTGAKLSVLYGHSNRVNLTSVPLEVGSAPLSPPYGQTGVEFPFLQVPSFSPPSPPALQVDSFYGQTAPSHSQFLPLKVGSPSYDQTVPPWDDHTSLDFPIPEYDRDLQVTPQDQQTFAKFNFRWGYPEMTRFPASTASNILSIDAKAVYQANCTTRHELAIPLGMSIDSIVEAVQVPGLDLCIILLHRKQPPLAGLLAVKVDNNDNLCTMSLCWFPPYLSVISLAVSPLSRVAIGCGHGRVLLLDIDYSSLL